MRNIFEKSISYCKMLVEKELGWLPSSEWYHSDYEELSVQILKKSKIYVSTTTLKRIWGKIPSPFKPNRSTLNALAKYLGYFNWLEFYKKNEENIIRYNPKKNRKKFFISLNISEIFTPKNRKAFPIFFLALIVVVCVSIFLNNKHKKNKYNQVKFSVNDTIGLGLPYVVNLKYDVSMLKTDSIYIKCDKKSERSLIKKHEYERNIKVNKPGRIIFTLVIENKDIKKDTIFLYTNEWVAGLLTNKNEYFFKEKDIKKDSIISIDYNNMDISSEKLSYYYFSEDFKKLIFDDVFSFESRVKLYKKYTYETDNIIGINLTFKNGFIEIPLTKNYYPGITLYLNENIISSRFSDLYNFKINITDWNTVFFKSRNKYVSIYINNKLAYEGSYNKPLKELIGIRIWFRSQGAVDYFKLYDEQNEVVFSDNFHH